jgi:hypothetical protein
VLLTPEELRQLTGFARRSRQIEWLRSRAWTFEISGTGHPKVDRAEYERHMIGGTKPLARKKPEPDLSWFATDKGKRSR